MALVVSCYPFHEQELIKCTQINNTDIIDAVYLFNHSIQQRFMSSYYMPGYMEGTGDTIINKLDLGPGLMSKRGKNYEYMHMYIYSSYINV